MPELDIGEASLLAALSNVTLFGSFIVLPALLGAYILKTATWARTTATDFALRKLEYAEVDRALLVYRKVSSRIQEIHQECDTGGAAWFAAYYRRKRLKQEFSKELEELEGYARHLRCTITRLRRKPIERFTAWIHTSSLRFAFGCSLAAYAVTLALLIAAFYTPELPPGLLQAKASMQGALLWQPFDGSVVYPNWLAAWLATAAVPFLYFFRRTMLYREHSVQFRNLLEFASTEPDALIDQPWASTESAASTESGTESAASTESGTEPSPAYNEPTCFAVLGLSPSATIEEVKQAYKSQVKQAHPDRVHGLSPVFQALAESEMKKLNAAYEEALVSLQHA